MTASAFLAAATSGQLDVVASALGTDPDLADTVGPDGTSAALLALYQGQEAVARLIVEARPGGPDVFEAAALGDTARLSMLLDFRNAAVDAVSPDGFTPLHLAAFFGRYVTVKALLERKTPVNIVSANAMGVTPLHAAVAEADESTSQAIAAALLNAGADPNAAQANGFTPLRAALQKQHAALEKLLRAAGATG